MYQDEKIRAAIFNFRVRFKAGIWVMAGHVVVTVCHGEFTRISKNGHESSFFGISGINLPVQPAELITHYELLLSACLKAIIAVQNLIEGL